MATVTHYIPTASPNILCPLGGLHQQQPLNLVCLDPLCRSHPLACCICFSQTHKYHKVVGLSKFYDDYRRNVGAKGAGHGKGLAQKIGKHYRELQQQIQEFKAQLIDKIDAFSLAIDKYTEHLYSQSQIRTYISQTLNLELEPSKLTKLRNKQQIQKSMQYILNNSLYDSNLNMMNVTDILKQNEDRVCALLDKMGYMTHFSIRAITEATNQLKFANQTIKQEKVQISKKIEKGLTGAPKNTSDLAQFQKTKSQLSKILQNKVSLILHSQPEPNPQQQPIPPPSVVSYRFSKHRHPCLQLVTPTTVSSSVSASTPQYALVWPNINLAPLQCQQWSIKIKRCRDLASKNTLAVGICKLSDMELAKYGGEPTNCLMVSSQGFISLNGNVEKSQFVFREGDTVHVRYDPYYRSIQVSKDNGRKLCLKSLGTDEPVYACVRLTYASDQVQFL